MVLLSVSVKGSFKSPWEDLAIARLALPPFPLQLLRAFGPWGVDREESRIRAGKLSEEIDGANCDETQHYQEKSQGESGHQAL